MVMCSVKQCGGRKTKNHPEITFHRFPVKEVMRKKWLEVIGTANMNPRHKMWHVCSLHFDETCFNKTLDVVRLRDGAVPSSSLLIPSASNTPILHETQNIPEPTCFIEVELPAVNVKKSMELAKVPDNSPVLQETENMPVSTCSTEVEFTEDNCNKNAELMTIRQQEKNIEFLTKKCQILTNKVKNLRQMVFRRNKKISHFSTIIKDLQKRKFINIEELYILEECAGPADFLKRK